LSYGDFFSLIFTGVRLPFADLAAALVVVFFVAFAAAFAGAFLAADLAGAFFVVTGVWAFDALLVDEVDVAFVVARLAVGLDRVVGALLVALAALVDDGVAARPVDVVFLAVDARDGAFLAAFFVEAAVARAMGTPFPPERVPESMPCGAPFQLRAATPRR
jgi:hypothetical protein